MNVLRAIVSGDTSSISGKDLKYTFDVRRIFEHQERQKVLGR